MGWKKMATEVGIGALIAAMKGLEGRVSPKQFRRLVATAVAELLTLLYGKKKARRRAARLVGAKPTKVRVRASPAAAGLEAVLGMGATEVVQRLGKRAKRKLEHQAPEPPPAPQGA